MVLPNRCSVFLLLELLVLVSSFSSLLPSHGTTRQHKLAVNSPSFFEQKQPNEPAICWATSRRRNNKSPFVLSMSSQAAEAQGLFSKYCDKDSLINRKTVESMPPFAEMLADGDLLPAEFDDIWKGAPKTSEDSSRVDAESFAKIYRSVDDLFEDEEETLDSEDDGSNEVSVSANAAGAGDNDLDEELSKAYKSISDENGLISKDQMMAWDEIENLLEEGLLGEDEFEELWKKAVNEKSGSLDASGFLAFNMGLDDLFVLEDEDGDDDEAMETSSAPRAMVIEGDMPPGVLFSQLADGTYFVGMKELNLWTELKDLLEDGDLLESELQEMYDKYATSEASGKLNEETFLQLYDDIDALFEEIDDEEEEVAAAPAQQKQQQPQSPEMNIRVKQDLLAFIEIIIEEDEEPCGFGASESDQGQVLNIVQVLEQQPSNLILQKEGNIEPIDLAGNWDLVYTSSSAMKFNQGLSGIGGSFPNGKFGGVRQVLTATKFLSDMEYKERIDVTPSSASFDVTVNGIWDLRKSMSLFTGQPTVILNVEPDRVSYGPTSTRADHWKSLGPVNRLDLSYLDDDLRIMRGCTSSETLFVFKKIQ